MFSRGEIRLLGMTLILFLAGLGWRSAQARLALSPLQVDGTQLEWNTEAAVESDSAGVVALPKHSSRPAKPSKISGSLDPNLASVAQLQTLPGIGPALAVRIAEARADGPFKDPDDLLRVKGIGPAKLEKLRPHLTF